MNTEIDSVKAVSERIKDAEDRLLENADILARAKERLIFDPSAYKRPSSGRPVAFAGLATAAAVAAAVLMMILGVETLTVQVDGKPVDTGAWISSPAKGCTLAFSDGSTIRLKSSSGLRIRELTADGAHILMERGELEAGVVHRGKTNWKLDVGPYVITVVGTKFQLGWNPDEEALKLHMTEGSVRIEGPLVAARTLQAGETLFASLTEGTVKIDTKDPSRADSEPPSVVSSDPARMTAKPVAVNSNSASNDPLPRESADGVVEKKKGRVFVTADVANWQGLADLGRFAEAVTAAQKFGIGKILSDSPAAAVLSLGDAARHSGNFSVAADAYKGVRKRFPSTAHSSNAAFALGIMAFDGRKDYADAARWFETCLKDKRRGTLSREASGRLMEAYRLLGDKSAAKEAASQYLAAYPTGPHAALAHRLTQK